MAIETLVSVIGSAVLVGGVLLGIHWFAWAKPKVDKVVEKEISDCREIQTKLITQGFATISREIKGVGKAIDYHRDRLDKHINGHD